MSGLSGLLDLGAGALLAQTAGISVVGRNTANVNTEGYSRESVLLRAELGNSGGVSARGVVRSQDQLLATRERQADGSRAFSQDLSARLSALEGALTSNGAGMSDAMAAFFGGMIELASAPGDATLRQKAVGLAQNAGAAFRDASSTITGAIGESNAAISDYATRASGLAKELAALNDQSNGSDPTIADRRDLVARKLTELVGGKARIDRDGLMRFTLENGAVLVDGDRAATMRAVVDPADPNRSRVELVDGNHRDDVTAGMQRGRIAAQLDFRDNVAGKALQQLDQLAFDFGEQLNQVHRNNEALDGSSGRDLFVPAAQVEGAAAAFAVDPDLAANPSLLAGRGPGLGANDGSGFLALADLKDSTLAGGGTRTFVDEAISAYSMIGAEAARASSDLTVAETRSDMLASLRDSVSGVSLEEELARLAQFQHAAEASAKFVSVVDDLMSSLTNQL